MECKTENSDYYPTLSIKIGNASWDDNQFNKNGKIIIGDFDTGATGIFISYEYLKKEGIITDQLNFTNIGMMFGDTLKFIKHNLKVSLVSSTGESQPVIMPCDIVFDFDKSPFTKYFKDRKAIIGRQIFNYFDSTTIEFDRQNKETTVIFQDWKGFEKEVANLFRLLGLQVKKNVNLSGNQIDIFLTEQTTSGKTLKTIVECKFYKKPVGVQELKELSYVFEFSKSNKLADHAILVSSSGFTKDAFLIADTAGIELLEIEELRSKVGIKNKDYKKDKVTITETEYEISDKKKDEKTAFVIMPFKDEFKDIYMLGFREVLSNYGYVCIRADEVQFNDRILDKIRELIKDADVIIAELTEQNTNVYYELGIAHTLDKTVILCTKDISNAPFDVNSYNHLVYSSIVELREKLKNRIESLIIELK